MEIQSNTKKALSELGKDIVNRIQFAIKRSGKVNTGKLYNSIRYKLDESGIRILLIGYGKYVIGTDDNWKFYPHGRRPGQKPPPSKVIEKWLNTPHGTRAFNKMRRSNRRLTKKQAAFIISRSIGRKGIKSMKWQDSVEETLKTLDTKQVQRLEIAYIKDLESELKKGGTFVR